jgi:Outer membrane protein beta-barrel domain
VSAAPTRTDKPLDWSMRHVVGPAKAGHYALPLVLTLISAPASAQDEPRIFAGALYGVSALSADARAETTISSAAVSLYDPHNGPALNVFVGIHAAQYFSVQANWMWNRNDLALVSSFAAANSSAFYDQRRDSRQHAVVLDGLVYFRRLDSPIRPYLGTGLSVVHFSSEEIVVHTAQGLTPPAGTIASTRIGLRSHVGIDFRLSRQVAFRYSFSETISGNPIGPSLMPPGHRALMNFQNLFGLVGRF